MTGHTQIILRLFLIVMDEDLATTPAENVSLKRPREDWSEPEGARSAKGSKLEQPIAETSGPDAKGEKKGKRDAPGPRNSRQGKDKNDKNRDYRRGSRPEHEEPREDDGKPKAPRLPKRQSGLLIGFCGTGCAGMQMSVHFSLVAT